MKSCLLYDRNCIECGECQICDIDSTKICDNCCICVETDADYAEILITDIISDEKEIEKYGN